MASIAKSVDKMLVLFPFEEKLYQEAGVPVVYVGHPMADQTSDDDGTAAARAAAQAVRGAQGHRLAAGQPPVGAALTWRCASPRPRS